MMVQIRVIALRNPTLKDFFCLFRGSLRRGGLSFPLFSWRSYLACRVGKHTQSHFELFAYSNGILSSVCDFNALSSIPIILSVVPGHKKKETLSTQKAQPEAKIILLSELSNAPKTGFEPLCIRGAVLCQSRQSRLS